MCALIHYVNSVETALSKTSCAQEWGKPTQRQLLGYDKGARMSDLFTPQDLCTQALKLQPLQITTANFPQSLADTPLCTMLKFEEKSTTEITAAESLVEIIQVTEKRTVEEKARKVVLDIFMLQSARNTIYSQEISIDKDLYAFYQEFVCCDVDAALNLSIKTVHQSKCSEWFRERSLRITASNGYKLKGKRFNVEKVITNLLNPGKYETSAMAYGKKTEETALKEYTKLVDPSSEIIKVGLIICLQQPWLSCSPDAILVDGPNIWQKRLVEIKCPYTCRKIPVFDEKLWKPNVQYLKMDQNGLQLSKTHSIYIQVQLQMYITKIELCDLFIYSPQGSVLIKIGRDEELLSQLVPHLEQFYFNNYIKSLNAKYSTR